MVAGSKGRERKERGGDNRVRREGNGNGGGEGKGRGGGSTHTLWPLAGAALSIEGAYLLGQQLAKLGSSPSLPEVQTALSAYQREHEARVEQCRSITRFTQLLASPTSPLLEGVRNSMRFVPQVYEGRRIE